MSDPTSPKPAHSSVLSYEGNGYPVIKPFKTINELLTWVPTPNQSICAATVPLQQKQQEPSNQTTTTTTSKPRLLACHDMCGNYAEDRIIQGAGDAAAYTFTAWPIIDVFVYFSHNFITVPPPGWTNAGHKHNVPVLGTFITEWEAGAEKCNELFESIEMAEKLAEKMTQLAKFLNFDGWIINIENVMQVEHIPNLLHFLKTLTASMHKTISPNSLLIWYDAVTTEGKLEWQNTLNDQNRPFFDTCDALWVNYTWKERTPEEVAAVAGERRHDVFMGVDCYGRGTYGGGGMDCDIAIKASLQHDLSCALFAVGWPFDHQQQQSTQQEEDEEKQQAHCLSLQTAYINSTTPTTQLNLPTATLTTKRSTQHSLQLQEHLTAHAHIDSKFWQHIATAWTNNNTTSRARILAPTVTALPFATDFSTGKGLHYVVEGQVVGQVPWYNISLTSPQPLAFLLPPTINIPNNSSRSNRDISNLEEEEDEGKNKYKYKGNWSVQRSDTVVYNGGSSLCFVHSKSSSGDGGDDDETNKKDAVVFPLYTADVPIPVKSVLIVNATTAFSGFDTSSSSSQPLFCIQLVFETSNALHGSNVKSHYMVGMCRSHLDSDSSPIAVGTPNTCYAQCTTTLGRRVAKAAGRLTAMQDGDGDDDDCKTFEEQEQEELQWITTRTVITAVEFDGRSDGSRQCKLVQINVLIPDLAGARVLNHTATTTTQRVYLGKLTLEHILPEPPHYYNDSAPATSESVMSPLLSTLVENTTQRQSIAVTDIQWVRKKALHGSTVTCLSCILDWDNTVFKAASSSTTHEDRYYIWHYQNNNNNDGDSIDDGSNNNSTVAVNRQQKRQRQLNEMNSKNAVFLGAACASRFVIAELPMLPDMNTCGFIVQRIDTLLQPKSIDTADTVSIPIPTVLPHI